MVLHNFKKVYSLLFDYLVHIIGKFDGRIFDNRTVEFVMSEGSDAGLVAGLEYALRHFKEGELSRVQIAAKYGYGADGCSDLGIPANVDLTYEARMINFTRVIAIR